MEVGGIVRGGGDAVLVTRRAERKFQKRWRQIRYSWWPALKLLTERRFNFRRLPSSSKMQLGSLVVSWHVLSSSKLLFCRVRRDTTGRHGEVGVLDTAQIECIVMAEGMILLRCCLPPLLPVSHGDGNFKTREDAKRTMVMGLLVWKITDADVDCVGMLGFNCHLPCPRPKKKRERYEKYGSLET